MYSFHVLYSKLSLKIKHSPNKDVGILFIIRFDYRFTIVNGMGMRWPLTKCMYARWYNLLHHMIRVCVCVRIMCDEPSENEGAKARPLSAFNYGIIDCHYRFFPVAAWSRPFCLALKSPSFEIVYQQRWPLLLYFRQRLKIQDSLRVLMEILPWHFGTRLTYSFRCVCLYVQTISNNLGSRKHIMTCYTHMHTRAIPSVLAPYQ